MVRAMSDPWLEEVNNALWLYDHEGLDVRGVAEKLRKFKHPEPCEMCRWNAGFGARKPEDHNEDCPIPQMLEEAKPNLDPQPWLFISDQVFGEFRSDHDKGYHDVSGTYWVFSPREQYVQARSEYER